MFEGQELFSLWRTMPIHERRPQSQVVNRWIKSGSFLPSTGEEILQLGWWLLFTGFEEDGRVVLRGSASGAAAVPLGGRPNNSKDDCCSEGSVSGARKYMADDRSGSTAGTSAQRRLYS
jgi:hypothetical protein